MASPGDLFQDFKVPFGRVNEDFNFTHSLDVSLNSSDFFPRESLGILPDSALARDSLVPGLQIDKTINIGDIGSPRESLGILNISAVDFDMESTEIFHAKNSYQQGLKTTHKLSPLISGNLLTNGVTVTNNGVFVSCPSKLLKFSIDQKNESSFLPNFPWIDPLNEAFQISSSSNIKHLLSDTTFTFSKNVGGNNSLISTRKRFSSLPVGPGANEITYCKGINNSAFDDSVFVEAKKVATIISDSLCQNDDSINEEGEMLDATPQPEWPQEWNDEVEDNKKVPCNKEEVFKKVDKLFGKVEPSNSEQKDQPPLDSNKDCVSPETIVVVPKVSQSSNNEDHTPISNISSQNSSQGSKRGRESVSRLINNLAHILHENEDLSTSQKDRGENMLSCLSQMLTYSRSQGSCSDDSGHRSGDDHQKGRDVSSEKNSEECSGKSDELCQPLDLSRKSKSSFNSTNPKLSTTFSPLNRSQNIKITISPCETALEDHSNTKAGPSNGIPCGFSGRLTLDAGKLKKSKSGISGIVKKGPLRATVPIESMAKDAKKTTRLARTPDTKLKPMASSTPTFHSNNIKGLPISPLARPKYNRSSSSSMETKESSTKTRHSISTSVIGKPPDKKEIRAKLVRSNSIESALTRASSLKGPTRSSSTMEKSRNTSATSAICKPSEKKETAAKLVRSNSIESAALTRASSPKGGLRPTRSSSITEKPRIISALIKARQNIMNSPHYNNKTTVPDQKTQSDKTTMGIPAKKADKENVKP